jgi:ribosomal RNA-processing protein 8
MGCQARNGAINCCLVYSNSPNFVFSTAQELYTTSSSNAFDWFSSSPELYEQYHVGFRRQVEQWPVYPVSMIAKWLVTNFCKQSLCVVADFGCGVAALAQKLGGHNHKGLCPFRVHSFDLVAARDLVMACDMANVPLKSKTVDMAVFCLSLMGTNLAGFLHEAHCLLKDVGILKIAEVRSQFKSTDKKDELEEFVLVLDKLAFKCLKMDQTNEMLVMLECKKLAKSRKQTLRLQPSHVFTRDDDGT